MPLYRVAERQEKVNDVYLLDTLNNRILINDDYKGFKVLGPGLESIYQIDAPNDATVYSTYPNPSQNLVLYYYPDSRTAGLLSLTDMTVTSIPLPDDAILSPIHFWSGSTLILSTYAGTFLALSGSGGAVRLSAQQVKAHFPDVYSFWGALAHRDVLQVLPSLTAIVEESEEVTLYVHGTGITQRFRKPDVQYHQVTFCGTHILYVAEDSVYVASPSGDMVLLPSDTSRTYMKASFLPNSSPPSFALLSSDKGDHSTNWIEIYTLQ